MTKTQAKRKERLMPNGIPRWIRVYDLGETAIDRYTVVFSKKSICENRPYWYSVLGMSVNPFSPIGFGQHSEYEYLIDTWKNGKYCWPPAMGRKCHLGIRMPFEQLPEDCKKFVIKDYKELWEI